MPAELTRQPLSPVVSNTPSTFLSLAILVLFTGQCRATLHTTLSNCGPKLIALFLYSYREHIAHFAEVPECTLFDGALKIPEDPIECALQLKSVMIDRVTYYKGGTESDSLYANIRQLLMEDESVRNRLPRAVRVCRILDELWDLIQPDFPTYASRREYFREEFDPLLTFLEERARNPAGDVMDAPFDDFSIAGVRTTWRKAIERINDDPEGAITAARSLVESVCKHVLEESGEPYSDLANIYRQTSRLLNLAPDQQSEQSFRQTVRCMQLYRR